jgi:hypothetical protein
MLPCENFVPKELQAAHLFRSFWNRNPDPESGSGFRIIQILKQIQTTFSVHTLRWPQLQL